MFRRLTFVVFVFLLIGFAFTTTGCAARINRVMSSWQGHHFSNLIARWGPPQQVFDDGYGGRILIWTAQRSYTTSGTSTTYGTDYGYIWTARTTYNPAETYGWTAHRMFWINKDGFVYRWAWRGL